MVGAGGNDIRRWVLFAQFVLALGVWRSLSNAIQLLYRGLGINTYRPFGVNDWVWAAFAVTGAALIYLLRNPVAQEFANDVMVELRKVTWPGGKEVRQSTVVVIVTVVIVSLILGAFDLLWANVIQYLLDINTTPPTGT
jgi:preprotein translocase subunit SecE